MDDVKDGRGHCCGRDGVVWVVALWWVRINIGADAEFAEGEMEELDLFCALRRQMNML
jgi:hypothetical protein